jgi:hypothetical protein
MTYHRANNENGTLSASVQTYMRTDLWQMTSKSRHLKYPKLTYMNKRKEFLQKNLATISFFPGTYQNRLDVMVEQHVHELRQKTFRCRIKQNLN